MSNASQRSPEDAPKATVAYCAPALTCVEEHIVVVGAGPVGIRFAAELLKRKPHTFITVFGNEPYQPYNRVQLSSLLAGDIAYEEILTPLPDHHRYPNFSHVISAIRHIDHEAKTLTDISGNTYAYDKCVIATGSRPHKPHIPGIELTGVYTFRNLKDAEALYARASRARHIVVVGGGLLGLEAAKALLRFHTEVTVVQQGPRLMNRQLDDAAAAELHTIVTGLGIRVIVNSGVRAILGDGRVSGVITRDKTEIACDTVVLCAGIKPNIEIAREARIRVANGIVVDDRLQTSAADVYAIGECCEHRGATYGLANPGFEQASILAANFAGGQASYVGSLEVSRLKVVGANICSMGDISELEGRSQLHEFVYQRKKQGIYRKIVLHKWRLIGAVSMGDWDETRRVQEAYQSQRLIFPWHILSFLVQGKLFFADENQITLWPRDAIVCQCNGIPLGECIDAVEAGNTTLKQLQTCTRAGTVCGSCKPLLRELLGSAETPEKEKAWLPSAIGSAVAIALACLVALLPALSVSESVQQVSTFEGIWNDKFWKQVSGFTLLGLSALGLLMSLRKRVKGFKAGDYAYWRLLHIALGVLCAGLLIVHTGLHLGANLNQLLMLNFLATIVLGALAGGVTALSHTLSPLSGKRLRAFWTWSHILLTWPLPMLLGFHIISVYYF